MAEKKSKKELLPDDKILIECKVSTRTRINEYKEKNGSYTWKIIKKSFDFLDGTVEERIEKHKRELSYLKELLIKSDK